MMMLRNVTFKMNGTLQSCEDFTRTSNYLEQQNIHFWLFVSNICGTSFAEPFCAIDNWCFSQDPTWGNGITLENSSPSNWIARFFLPNGHRCFAAMSWIIRLISQVSSTRWGWEMSLLRWMALCKEAKISLELKKSIIQRWFLVLA